MIVIAFFLPAVQSVVLMLPDCTVQGVDVHEDSSSVGK